MSFLKRMNISNPQILNSINICFGFYEPLQDLIRYDPKGWNQRVEDELKKMGRLFGSGDEFGTFTYQATSEKQRQQTIQKKEEYTQRKQAEAKERHAEAQSEMERAAKGNYFLEGPISLTQQYHSKWDMEIMVMGDWHVVGEGCGGKNKVDIRHALDRLFQNHNSEQKHMLDFFLETPFRRKDQTNLEPSPFTSKQGAIERYFHRCFLPDKTSCDDVYSNVRFHYADVRRLHDRVIGLVFDPVYDWQVEQGIVQPLSIAYQLDALRSFLKDVIVPLTKSQTVKQVWTDLKIYKQLNAIQNKTTKTYIQRYFGHRIVGLAKRILIMNYPALLVSTDPKTQKDFDTKYSQWKVSPDMDQIGLQPPKQAFVQPSVSALTFADRVRLQLTTDVWSIHQYFMDVYLLARVFRSFKGGNSNPKRIVIYAGESHAQLYRVMFRELGFQTTREIRSQRNKVHQ